MYFRPEKWYLPKRWDQTTELIKAINTKINFLYLNMFQINKFNGLDLNMHSRTDKLSDKKSFWLNWLIVQSYINFIQPQIRILDVISLLLVHFLSYVVTSPVSKLKTLFADQDWKLKSLPPELPPNPPSDDPESKLRSLLKMLSEDPEYKPKLLLKESPLKMPSEDQDLLLSLPPQD